MKFFNRGLYALILTMFFQTQLTAEYLYKDEVIHRPAFNHEVETLGAELYSKTGISLRLIMLKEIPDGMDIITYEKEILKTFKEPTIVLVFAEKNSKLDVLANSESLYKYFDKKQVMSPMASPVQAFVMAILYADSWEHFNSLRKDYGGTMIPLIAQRTDDNQVIGKYAGTMFNGYIDIAQQISKSKGVVLVNDPGNANQTSILIVKIIFYSIVLIGIYMYLKRVIYRRKHRNENNK